MKRAGAALVLAALATAAGPPRDDRYDVIVRGGLVLDGTGASARRADVGVRGDAVAAVGDLSGAHAAEVLDAQGAVVAPGFIDLLGNSQAAVLLDPALEGKLRQGVTTEVTGEGHSPGPLDEAMAAEMQRTAPEGWPPVAWRTLEGFGREVMKKGSALNFAFYLGATNPREMVLGQAARAPSAAELRRMVEIAQQARGEGAVGLASALIYPPGRFAAAAELTALAAAAGSYWTHLRNEGNGIEEAIEEALAVARSARVPLNIFHLKVAGEANWGRMGAVVRRLEAARAGGVDLAACVYPYTASSTALTSIVPAWALAGTYQDFVARLRHAPARTRLRAELEQGRLAGAGAESILVRALPADALRRHEGQRLGAIARALGVAPAEAALRLFEGSRSSPVAIFFSLHEDDLREALRAPWVAVCSDSGAVVAARRREGAHPRAYGTFPRILARYVREEKLLTLAEAVRRMTSLAADRAGLRDRGRLRPGAWADVVVFDPAGVRDLSTYEDPHQFSTGIRHLLVNGRPVLRAGRLSAERPGRILAPAGPPR